MSGAGRKWVGLVAAYFIVGMVSFGWVFNHSEPEIHCWRADPTDCFETQKRAGQAVLAGMFWPIVWSGAIALTVTRWP